MCYLTAHCSTTSHSISVPMSAFPRAIVLLNHDSLYKTSKLHSKSRSQLGHITNVPCKPSETKIPKTENPKLKSIYFGVFTHHCPDIFCGKPLPLGFPIRNGNSTVFIGQSSVIYTVALQPT